MKFPLLTFFAAPLFSALLHGADTATVQADFFENKIRPLLAERCYECHSAEKKQKGGLLLDTKEGTLKGGDTGAAFVAGDPAKSLLIKAVKWADKDLQMPPKKQLTDEQIAALEKWIAMGAPDPRDGKREVTRIGKLFDQAKTHWAFQPLNKANPPTVKDAAWVRNDVDRFILAGLEAKGIHPSAETDRRTLIRRVNFDLIGLPPSPEEVEAFAKDPSPDAYERIVDRLLASPQYGERWGRHWLDLARYADSSGMHNDLDRPHAWRYRDYVIRSFNDDKPYARFIAEQLAGDEVEGTNEDALVATGFCRNGPSNEDNMGNNKEQYRLDELDDVISTTSSVFLGLTMGCARCHDHKYDPITAEDYYRLLAVFNGTEKLGVPKESKGKEKANLNLQALIETGAKVRPTFLLRRGSLQNRGPEVHPGAPAVLAPQPILFSAPAENAKSSGRRRTFAEWIGAPENALTWRVLANRIWQHHFGEGIVGTPNNFGFNGARPSHPELLDFLAQQLIASGGRMKPVHRLIVLSATYRQSSHGTESGARLDPQNTLFSRMNIRRMEAEILRDSMLSVSGKLNPQMGGAGIKPRIRADLLTASQRNKWPALTTEGPEQWRRSVYIYVKRQLLMPMMELFDAPVTTESAARRTESVVPTQALVLMNDEFVEDQAGFLAERAAERGGDLPRIVLRMYALAMSRPPADARLQQALAFVQSREKGYVGEKTQPAQARHRALTDLAHVLFNSSEFIHIE